MEDGNLEQLRARLTQRYVFNAFVRGRSGDSIASLHASVTSVTSEWRRETGQSPGVINVIHDLTCRNTLRLSDVEKRGGHRAFTTFHRRRNQRCFRCRAGDRKISQ
jgi:hypothetical protein